MALGDFSDKMKETRSSAEKKYMENKDEAWEEIKRFFSAPTTWIVAGIAVLLIVAGVFTIKFIGAVRAPELPSQGEQTPINETEPPVDGEDEPIEEIDDSNTVQPVLTGERKEDFYTFLLVGTDKEGTNTDTIMVVSYDVKNQKLNLMSIPRDTMVNVSWDIKKINSVYSMSGVRGLKKHVGRLIGFEPDYYVKIDLNAFVEVVNLIGGVEFDVPIPMHYHDPYQDLSIDLEPGLQKLNGEQAMGLVRFRKSDRDANGRMSGYDDTGRVQTQQAFLKEMFKQCLKIKNWTKITGYVEIFARDVESDLTLGNMLWFARQAMNLEEGGFQACTIPGDYYASAWSYWTQSMQSYVTLYAQQVIQTVNESFNPYLANVTMANLDIMSINADGSVSSSTGYVADSRAATAPVFPSDDDETDNDTDDETGETSEGEDTEDSGGEDGNTQTEGTGDSTEGTGDSTEGTGEGTENTDGSDTGTDGGSGEDDSGNEGGSDNTTPEETGGEG